MVQVRDNLPCNTDGTINLENWLKHFDCDNELVRSACTLARITGEDKANIYGQSCYLQGLEMAEEAISLHLGNEAVAAAVIYPCAQYANLAIEDIQEQLGHKTAQLVKSTQHLTNVSLSLASGKQVDSIRKMLLSMVQDVRVVMIKLAARLSVMRNIGHLDEEQKQQLALETSNIYAPLASRLGAGDIKWQLEDLCFSITNKETYFKIAKSLKERRVEREARVEHLTKTLNQFLHKSGIKGEVQGRAKHIYSIYRKMTRKKVGLEEIYDAIALRILVPTIDDCYTLLSYVHDTWQPIPEEFDDYISNPKPNGYQSIHTAAIDKDGNTFEVQIRTQKMHEESEMGVAAHWLYKEGSAASGFEEKIKWLRNLLEWQKEVSGDETVPEELEKKLFEDRIYVFTPNGKIVDLAEGATPLDFAYHVHTDVGHRCRGAKVHGKLVPLTTPLKMGDVVEIMTTKESKPSRDWLIAQHGYLTSSRARAKVLHWFKRQDFDRHVEDGRTIFERELKRLNLDNPNLEKLAQQLRFKNTDLMFASLGNGDLKLTQIVNAVQRDLQVKQEQPQEFTPQKIDTSRRKGDIDVSGVGNLLTQIANCCKPVPGDPIVGYVTQGRGVSIHHKNCKNILNVDDDLSNRLIEVDWVDNTRANYPVEVEIIAYDRPGLVGDVAQVLSNDKLSIINLVTTTNKKQHEARINVTIEINDLDILSKVIDRFNQIPNVHSVTRKRGND